MLFFHDTIRLILKRNNKKREDNMKRKNIAILLILLFIATWNAASRDRMKPVLL